MSKFKNGIHNMLATYLGIRNPGNEGEKRVGG